MSYCSDRRLIRAPCPLTGLALLLLLAAPHLLRDNVRQVQRVLDHEAASGSFDPLNIIVTATPVAPPPATLILLSSGLSIAGGLVTRVGWDANSASIAGQLKARGLLPSLTGYHVVFSGLADTAGRQPALPLPQRTALTAYWLAICQASDAASCSIDNVTQPDPPSRSTTPGGTAATVPDTLLFQFKSATLLPTADSILEPIAVKARSQRAMHAPHHGYGYHRHSGRTLRADAPPQLFTEHPITSWDDKQTTADCVVATGPVSRRAAR
jgi:hypothetical protein